MNLSKQAACRAAIFAFLLVCQCLFSPKASAQAPTTDTPAVVLPQVKPPAIEIPEVKVEAPMPKGAKDAAGKGKGFFKTLAASVKFREKVRQKQQDRIREAIRSWGITDSVTAAIGSMEKLLTDLKASNDQRYNELIALINEKSVDTYVPPVSPPVNPPLPEPKTPAPETGEASAALAPPPGTEKAKWEKLTGIRKVLAASGPVEAVVVSKDTAYHYNLRLTKKAKIYAFYDAASADNLSRIPFNIFTAVVYDRMMVEPGTGHCKIVNEAAGATFAAHVKSFGCPVYYTATIISSDETHAFLQNAYQQETFTADVLKLARTGLAGGVNLYFPALRRDDRGAFTAFIAALARPLRAALPGFAIAITVPPFDGAERLDVAQLSLSADVFFDDFTRVNTTLPGPLAALGGAAGHSVASSVSFYLGQQLAPEKLIVKLPYSGIEWATPLSPPGPAAFRGYLSYAQLRSSNSAWKVALDEETATFRMDSVSKNGEALRSIWFDNETTLSAKYDFILQNGLGGVAFAHLGDDGNYGELRDALLYKFIGIDSVLVKQAPVGPLQLGFWGRLSRKLALYGYITDNPCAVCFDAAGAATGRAALMHQYIGELGIDSIVRVKNAEIGARNKATGGRAPLLTEFTYLTAQLQSAMLAACLIILVLVAIVVIFYINRMRNKGYAWRYRRATAWTLVMLMGVFIISLFSLLFVSDAIPAFGVSSQAVQAAPATFPQAADAVAAPAADCMPEPGCINMPLKTLLISITLVAVITLIIARYLISPLVRDRKLV